MQPRWPSFAELRAATGESASAIHWLANRGRYVHHYHTTWFAKRHGRRLLEAPRPRLKHVQRVILRDILEHAPLHEAAMAFRKGRGVLDHAASHCGRRWVVSMDLYDFFPSIRYARVVGIFRLLGFPAELARVLAQLTTNSASLDGATTHEERQLYGHRHLPQGAPTSPALANLVARGIDRRLAELARSIDGTYSRYADDLVVSHDSHLPWLVPTIGAIAMQEGFRVRFRKTRVMSAARRQMVTGVVVNQRPTLQRRSRKQLEAVLFNCVRHGPASQDRQGLGERFRDHLRGRVAYAQQVDPQHARRLIALFAQIAWVPSTATPADA